MSQIPVKQQSREVKAQPRVARKAFDFKTLRGYFEDLENRALKRKEVKAPPIVANRAFEFKTLQGLFEEPEGRASALKRKVRNTVSKRSSSEEKTASVPCIKDAHEMEESSDSVNKSSTGSVKEIVGNTVSKRSSSEEKTASVPCIKGAHEMEESSDKSSSTGSVKEISVSATPPNVKVKEPPCSSTESLMGKSTSGLEMEDPSILSYQLRSLEPEKENTYSGISMKDALQMILKPGHMGRAASVTAKERTGPLASAKKPTCVKVVKRKHGKKNKKFLLYYYYFF